MQKLLKSVCLIAAIAAFNQSCTKSVIKEENVVITDVIKYESTVKQIMTANCIVCHKGASAPAGLDLTTYQSVKNAAENGKLIDRMNDPSNPMPQSGLLSVEIRNQIDKWKADGFLEN